MLTPDQEVLLEQWLEARKACQATYEVNCQADGERSRAQVACFEAGFDPYDYLTGDDLKRYESIVNPTRPGG